MTARLSDLATDLGKAVAIHIGCGCSKGYFDEDNNEVLGGLGIIGEKYAVSIFLDDLLAIAFETGTPDARVLADRYFSIIRTTAEAIAAANGVAVAYVSDSYDTIFFPQAVFGPAYVSQSEQDWLRAKGEEWANPIAFLNLTHYTPDEISANRRAPLGYYQDTSIWPLIEARLPGVALPVDKYCEEAWEAA